MARLDLSCLRTSLNVVPSSPSRRASVRSLIPSFFATTSARAVPCGRSGVTAFSTLTRSALTLLPRALKVSSQTLLSILLSR